MKQAEKMMFTCRIICCVVVFGLLGSSLYLAEQAVTPKTSPVSAIQRIINRVLPQPVPPSEKEQKAYLKKSNRSGFEKLEDLFRSGKKFSSKKQNTDMVLSGNCVRNYEPEKFIRSLMNVYIVGKSAKRAEYYVPAFEKNPYSAEFDSLLTDPKSFHNVKRSDLSYYTPAEARYPFSAPLSELFNELLRHSLFFTYVRTQEGPETPEDQIGKAYFQLRMAKTPENKPILMLSQLCESVSGCTVANNSSIYHTPYGGARVYCYYHESLRMDLQKKKQ